MLLATTLCCCLAVKGTAQSGQAPAQLTRQDVDSLLAKARTALEKGDFATADKLISQAENAQVRYPLIHMGDTPATLRRELVRATSRQQPAGSGNSLAAPPLGNPAQPGGTGGAGILPTNYAESQSPYAGLALEAPRDLPPIGDTASTNDAKEEAVQLMKAARAAMQEGDLETASRLASEASSLNVPETAFAAEEDRPSQLAWDLQQLRTRDSQVQPATSSAAPGDRYATPAGVMTLDPTAPSSSTAANERYPSLRYAQNNTQLEATPATSRSAAQLLAEGEEALRNQDRAKALDLFRQANAQAAELDVTARQRLTNHLELLSNSAESLPPTPSSNSAAAGGDNSGQQLLARQLSADVGRIQSESRQLREKDPKQALRMLEKIRDEVASSQLDETSRRLLLGRLDGSIRETEKYITDHRAELELDERNREVLAEIDRRSKLRLEMQNKIAELVNQFNQLRDEERYAEMQQVAQRLHEMAPDEPVVQQVWLNAKFIHRQQMQASILERKESNYWQQQIDVETAAIPNTFDGKESVYPDNWNDLVAKRKPSKERNRRRSPRELEIEQKLRQGVLIQYQNETLGSVMDDLAKVTGTNIVLDPRGLSQEGVSSETRVTLNLSTEIQLKSALNLILEPLHLSYVVKDEVLKITSEGLRDGEIYTETYPVADLVIPIPNFVPDNSLGMTGLINDAHAAMGYGAGSFGPPGPMALVNGARPNQGVTPNRVLAQPGMPNTGPGLGGPTTTPIGGGPGGMGGAASADFDSLIDLIISTVASDTWAENGGGEAEIRPFPGNLSLVISQTQAVHEEIADLLEQLRRLQDLQVTIEVRFIRLNDSFFERIGIDFDMNIENRSPAGGTLSPGDLPEGEFPSSVVGLDPGAAFPGFTADLDIPFRQESFNLAVPTFGGFQPVSSFGFAILSDIEAYFLINASQGDRRSNVLNAPKVTLFNGQQAFVSDTSQTPFVISVIPVVGEFAAAQQPVIVVLSEGTLLTIQAVVSDDRRYVRLTVVPFFSEIGDVQEFTFEGTTSTSKSSSTVDDDDDNNKQNSEAEQIIRSGTTVQLPTFSFVSVTTTVSVPDGGTVLLGGIKRLSEGRNEFGVPLLSKVPYINRLFRNVGIGRETDSLMMMVTPRIIIQEEEEARVTGPINP
jgi:general secretion pathway protein D